MFIVYIVVLPLSHYSDPACCHLPLANASYALIYANEVHEYIRRWLMNISDAPLTATRASWKRILSSSWGASGAFDDAFDDALDDEDGDAVACVETHTAKYYQSESSER